MNHSLNLSRRPKLLSVEKRHQPVNDYAESSYLDTVENATTRSDSHRGTEQRHTLSVERAPQTTRLNKNTRVRFQAEHTPSKSVMLPIGMTKKQFAAQWLTGQRIDPATQHKQKEDFWREKAKGVMQEADENGKAAFARAGFGWIDINGLKTSQSKKVETSDDIAKEKIQEQIQSIVKKDMAQKWIQSQSTPLNGSRSRNPGRSFHSERQVDFSDSFYRSKEFLYQKGCNTTFLGLEENLRPVQPIKPIRLFRGTQQNYMTQNVVTRDIQRKSIQIDLANKKVAALEKAKLQIRSKIFQRQAQFEGQKGRDSSDSESDDDESSDESSVESKTRTRPLKVQRRAPQLKVQIREPQDRDSSTSSDASSSDETSSSEEETQSSAMETTSTIRAMITSNYQTTFESESSFDPVEVKRRRNAARRQKRVEAQRAKDKQQAKLLFDQMMNKPNKTEPLSLSFAKPKRSLPINSSRQVNTSAVLETAATNSLPKIGNRSSVHFSNTSKSRRTQPQKSEFLEAITRIQKIMKE